MAKGSTVRQMEVNIIGQTLRLRSDADEAYIRNLARFVDGKLNKISRKAKTYTTAQVAMLAALDIADDYFKTRQNACDFKEDVRKRSRGMLNLLEREPTSDLVEVRKTGMRETDGSAKNLVS